MADYREKLYVGIDVSKATLDIFISSLKQHHKFTNDALGWKRLIKILKAFPDVLVAMESTGGYEKNVAQALVKANFAVAIINPRKVRDFAKAIGRMAKTDKIDAQLIALFAEKIRPTPNVSCDEARQELSDYQVRRKQVVDLLTAEKNQLDKASKAIKTRVNKHIKQLEKELEQLDNILKALVAKNESYAEKAALLQSVKGVGPVASVTLLAQLPELGHLDNKQIASLVGLAPYNRDSGQFRGERSIFGGRASVRCGLYMATLAAIRSNKAITVFYQRLIQAGKKKKVAIVACMRKLVVIMNVILKNKTPWQEMVPAL